MSDITVCILLLYKVQGTSHFKTVMSFSFKIEWHCVTLTSSVNTIILLLNKNIVYM